MKIEDYNKVTDRLELKKDCLKEVLNMIEENKKHKWSKRRIIPIIAVAVAACGTVTGVCANEFMGIFKKDTNFEMAITEIENAAAIDENNETMAETVPVYDAAMKKWDENVIQKLFAEGKVQVDGRDEQSDSDPDIIWKYREYDDNTWLCYEDGDISYRRTSDAFYSYPADKIVYYKRREIADKTLAELTNTDLKNVDKKEAIELADDIVNKLGINVTSEKTVYSLDKETLIKADNSRNEDGKRVYKHGEVLPEWTEEQEAYLIVYNAELNGIPVSNNRMSYGKSYDTKNGWRTYGSVIYAIVSKNGIETFYAGMIYEFTESKKQPIKICTAERAAEALIEKFDKKIPSYMTIIDGCRLAYHEAVKDGKYEMRPYWEFKSTEKTYYYTLYPEKETRDYYSTYFVDAETLEILSETSSY